MCVQINLIGSDSQSMYKMYSLNGSLGIQFLGTMRLAHVHSYNLVALVDHLISCMPFSTPLTQT